MTSSAMHQCRVCCFMGSDLQLLDCGCTLHAYCIPVTFLTPTKNPSSSNDSIGVQSVICPVCGVNSTAPVSRIKLLPLYLDKLDYAVDLRKKSCALTKPKGKDIDHDFLLIETEKSYLNLSRTTCSISASLSDNDSQRTGRWTDEEVNFVDFLVVAFDKGQLPLPNGIRLNEFLGDILMCKGSRLTKKMKHAKLCSRSYEAAAPHSLPMDCQMLSSLTDKFLQSITNEAARLEVRFNVAKTWRSYFSKFCVQAHSDLLDADDWLTSLEAMERRAAIAEENIRKARRRRMGLALKTDVNAEQGVFFAGMEARGSKQTSGTVNNDTVDRLASCKSTPGRDFDVTGTVSDDCSEQEMISKILDVCEKSGNDQGVEFSSLLNDFMDDNKNVYLPQSGSDLLNTSSGSFVHELVLFMEKSDLPFQHVDVWVPSTAPGKGPNAQEELRLFHAGHGTRHDLDPTLFWQLHEYGEYSTAFSFSAKGAGLPGRVYSRNRPSWERHIHCADPKIFERVGGAKVYGVKTALAFPLTTKSSERIIVALYSISDLQQDESIIARCLNEMKRFNPEPSWKLVVEMGNSHAKAKPSFLTTAEPNCNRSSVIHYNHSGIGDSSESTSYSDETVRFRQAEEELAALLGEHIPLSNGESNLPLGVNPAHLLPSFMSLRLLLLKPSSRRTKQETDSIDIVIKSYLSYCRDKRRRPCDIVLLIVQDWYFLTSSNGVELKSEIGQKRDSDGMYMSHVMNAVTSASSLNASGVPAKMPPSLPYFQPPISNQDMSFFDYGSGKKRRISGDLEDGSPSVNVVDEN